MIHDSDGYINCPHVARDRFVYRIVRLHHLYKLFHQKENVLVSPEKWGDSYENLVSRLAPLNCHCYGQCWTLHYASDAMWRIYSPGPTKNLKERAVRIRSKICNLLETIEQRCQSTHAAFIGQVQYLSTKNLTAYIEKRRMSCSDSNSYRTLAETLLVKRLAFKHEGEVRLLLISRDSHGEHGLFRYCVNPNTFIDQIMIDPRLDKNEADSLKREIESETRFTGGKITRSRLYAPPSLM